MTDDKYEEYNVEFYDHNNDVRIARKYGDFDKDSREDAIYVSESLMNADAPVPHLKRQPGTFEGDITVVIEGEEKLRIHGTVDEAGQFTGKVSTMDGKTSNTTDNPVIVSYAVEKGCIVNSDQFYAGSAKGKKLELTEHVEMVEQRVEEILTKPGVQEAINEAVKLFNSNSDLSETNIDQAIQNRGSICIG